MHFMRQEMTLGDRRHHKTLLVNHFDRTMQPSADDDPTGIATKSGRAGAKYCPLPLGAAP
jgi:hypothetical protein